MFVNTNTPCIENKALYNSPNSKTIVFEILPANSQAIRVREK